MVYIQQSFCLVNPQRNSSANSPLIFAISRFSTKLPVTMPRKSGAIKLDPVKRGILLDATLFSYISDR